MLSTRLLHTTLLTLSFIVSSSTVYAADIDAGKTSAAFCLGCHGADGNSKTAQYPTLAGQRASYLESQIKAFQSGKRSSSIMQGMVAKLSKDDIKNISAYFASLKTESAGADTTLAEKGKQAFARCAGCHGSDAQGRSSIPKLAGQQPAYIAKQLLSFQSGSRKGGPMNMVTSSLSEQTIKELAAYLGSL